MLVKTLKRSQKKIYPWKVRRPAQEHPNKSTPFPGTLSSSLLPLLEKIPVGSEVAGKSSYKSKRENCLRKELPKTIKGLNFARGISPKVNEFAPEGTKMIAKIILNSQKVTEIVNLVTTYLHCGADRWFWNTRRQLTSQAANKNRKHQNY